MQLHEFITSAQEEVSTEQHSEAEPSTLLYRPSRTAERKESIGNPNL